MSWTNLPTNYTDAVWSGLKKFVQIDNGDDTVSFQDVTVYTNRENSFFGANDANSMNSAINQLMTEGGEAVITEALKRQGFESVTTVFNADGSITQTNENGDVTTVEFNADGSITTTMVDSENVQVATATTVFNADGSIVTTATRA